MSRKVIVAALLCAAGPAAHATAQQGVSFARQVLPILSANCFQCHGESVQTSGLDLRSRQTMLRGGQRGPAIVPGNAAGSRLYRRIAGLETPQMPFGGRLSAADVATLRDWINQGAKWEGEVVARAPDSGAPAAAPAPPSAKTEIPPEARNWWAFRKPVRPRVPPVKDAEWSRHPIDAFLAQVFEQKGLRPAPLADRHTLVRRAFLDLTGLLPSPEEAAAFVADTAADAWERLIERLLASPHYGERWGRHWLDVARYADSSGFEHDRDRPVAWRYRDYVIESFNRDKPYNVFIAEQLAGDELDWVTFESKIATGFLRAGPRVEYREKDNPQYRFDYLDDMISATTQGMLGLTVQCARCHDHKFDPIPQADYYRLQAVFFSYVDVNHYLAPQDVVAAFLKKQDELDGKVKALREEIAELEAPWREKAFLAEAASKFPEDARAAVATPEAQRTPGQKLLAQQLLRAVGVPASALEKAMPASEKERRAALLAQVREAEKQRPQPPPYATGVTDGDYRFAPDSYGDEPAPGKGVKRDPNLKGSYLHRGDGPYQPPPSYLLLRGEMENRGPEMQPGFLTVATHGNPPAAIPPSHGRTSGRRRALAEWLTSPDNPLAARVMINRVWHHHFGRGIVATPSNFGKLGQPPTHPELLDWLATEFLGRGWSIKQMHRLIMTSRAYRMASQYESAENEKTDPENRLLWKFRARRMEAETIRDSVLAASGSLNRQLGGPPVFPKVDPSVLATMKNGIWHEQEEGPKTWRRSLYIYRKRGMPFPLLETFDLPDQNMTCSARNVSTVPTQALTLLNNQFILAQSRLFAERVAAEAGPDPAAQVARAWRMALSREPTDEERALALDMLETRRGSLVDLAHVLLNLNEFVYIR